MSSLIDKIVNEGINFAAKTGSNVAERWGNKAVAALIGVSADALQSALTALEQPSLCYVPILSESLSMRRTVDIGTTMLISQADQKKDFITDNAAPRPRTWTGSGYISSMIPWAENGTLIKPTVIMQQAILEAAADSRQSVKFKTDSGEVVDVLIQDLQISSTPKGANVRHIQYTVQEVKVLQNSSLLGTLDEVLGNTAVASIPKQAIMNLGQNTLLGAGIAVAASALLNIDYGGESWGRPDWADATTSEEVVESVEQTVTEETIEEDIEENPVSKEYEVRVKKAWEEYNINHKDVEKTGLIPVTDGMPVEEIELNILGKPVLFRYSTFRLSDFQKYAGEDSTTTPEEAEKDSRDITLQSLLNVDNLNLMCTLKFDVDKESATYEKWICSLAYIKASDSDADVPDRSFTVYPNTLHFEGDRLYIVSLTSKLSEVGFNDLPNAYITIGVPQYE